MEQVKTPPSGSVDSRYLPFLVLLFAGSGCAALIYEIVWFQLLQLAIGSTAVSLGILLATYMGGLCLGSILLPRLRRREHPLRVYAALEAGIGACGVLALLLIPLVGRVYFAWAPHGLGGMLVRGVVAAICLLPPTVLMGASLPAIARWTEATPRGASWWGLLYGGNTVGAVFGCLLAGFYLLRIYNTTAATFAAVAINLVVAGLSVALARSAPAQAGGGEPEGAPEQAVSDSGARWTGLRNHRAFRRRGPRRGGGLDAPHGHDAGRHGLRVLHHPGGVSDRPGDRQRLRVLAAAGGQPARGAGLVPASARGRNRLGRLDDRRFAAVLAHQSHADHQPLAHLPARYGPLPVGHSAAHHLVGREFSAGLRRRRAARRGPRAHGGRRVCRQYPGRHRGRAGHEPRADPLDRHAANPSASF